jgi:hypothetical protein
VKPHTTAKHVLSEEALAAMAGVSETTWKAHKAQGAPKPRSQSDLTSWVTRYHQWRRANGKGTPVAGSAQVPVDAEGAKWTNERKKWLAMLAKMEFGIRMRELVQRKDVVAFAGKAALTIRNRLNQLVQKLGAQFGDEVMQAAQLEVDDALASFERGLEPAHEHERIEPAAVDAGAADPGQLPTAEEADGQ